MEFKEYPSVEEGVDRKLVFNEIKWLSRRRFEHLVAESARNGTPLGIHPCLGGGGGSDINNNNNNNNNNSILNQADTRRFVGKTIPKSPLLNPTTNTREINRLGPCPYEFLEIVGSVSRRAPATTTASNKWMLTITHDDQIYEIGGKDGDDADADADFLVLCISDPDSFYWSSNRDETSYCCQQNTTPSSIYSFKFNNKKIARYALRAAVDKVDCKYSYVGRTLPEHGDGDGDDDYDDDDQDDDDDFRRMRRMRKRPKFYSNGWYFFGESVAPATVGRVSRSYKMLFAPHREMVLGFDEYETLCLKASPASLRVMCRTAVRKHLGYSQARIKSLVASSSASSSSPSLIPHSLVDFLKYPAWLKSGEWMMRDEKLVKEDDSCELVFDTRTGNLVCRPVAVNASSAASDESAEAAAASNESNKTNEKLIAYNSDTIWLHRFQAVFYNQVSSTVFTAHSIYHHQHQGDYKFFIEWDKLNSQVAPIIIAASSSPSSSSSPPSLAATCATTSSSPIDNNNNNNRIN